MDRIRATVDDRARVLRPGNRHPFARPENDAGPVSTDMRLERMILVLDPDAAQQRALDEFLTAQQNPESPQYHQWLTPEEFGNRFGVSQADSDQVVAWLEQHGLQIESVSAGRREIIFSGTAGQVASAFHTEIHTYVVDGETHYANASDPEIPLALAPVVGGVVSLHDFHGKPLHHSARPLYTSGGAHYLAPADFAAIYNVAGAYANGIDGAGQSIAVVGRTNINLSDVQAFRSMFGLPAKQPTVVLNGPDPGIVSRDEEMEAALDVQWAGAVARNAGIQFVVSGSTSTSDGVALSAQYIVNRNLAPVMTISFGSCESVIGSSGNKFWSGLWQQAAAQGITVLVASGDAGAAGCDAASARTATQAPGVNALCSPASSTCVGGTQFADTNASSYWSSSNAAGTYGSALGYLPEAVWNESGAVAGGSGLWASGGGASLVYPKPSWQVAPGVPADGRRYVPDVSLTSAGHDGYLVRLEGQIYVVAGTSAATPAFAGLMSLVGQKAGARLGNVNPALYTLAAKQSTGGAAVFHDITAGSNTVPGVSGFSATPGYDAATGLGSVDANTLVARWSDASAPTPAVQLSVDPASASVTVGSSVSVTVKVAVSGGFNAPVLLSTGTLPQGLTATLSATTLAAPGSGMATLKLTASSQMVPTSYSVTISAAGAGITQTISLPVAVAPVCSYSINPKSASVTAVSGSYSVAVTAPAGCAWTAASAAAWITLASGASGTGNGTVTYSVAANTATLSRSGSLTVAGASFVVTQAAAAASYTLSPASASVGQSGGSGSFAVTVNPSTTSWTAASTASWITVTSGASGTGSRTVSWSAAANTSGAARTGAITAGNTSFTITQAASCTYSIAIGSVTANASGYVGTVSVYAATGCKWTASSDASWLTVTAGASGAGNGTVNFLAAYNTTKTSRSGVLTVAGYAITITESASTSAPALKAEPLPTDEL
jgi:pseudomonalisin